MSTENIQLWVSDGTFSSPYYRFYTDAGGTEELIDLTLDSTYSYTFKRLNGATSHPFYVSDQGVRQPSTAAITLNGYGNPNAGIIGDEAFTISFNDSSATSNSLYFYCSVHPSMLGEFYVDYPEVPTMISSTSALLIAENQPTNSVVGQLTTDDSNRNEIHTYSFASGFGDDDNDLFQIEGDSLIIKESADYELKPSYSVRLKVHDKHMLEHEQRIQIDVLDVNEEPYKLELTLSDSVGTTDSLFVGSLFAKDPDEGQEVSFSLVEGEGGFQNDLFEIVENKLFLKDGLDQFSLPLFSIRLRAEDSGGLYKDQIFENSRLFLRPELEDGTPELYAVKDLINSEYFAQQGGFVSNQIIITHNQVDDGNGAWEWKKQWGTWEALPELSKHENNGFILSPSDLLRFNSNPDFNGKPEVLEGIVIQNSPRFKQWDDSDLGVVLPFDPDPSSILKFLAFDVNDDGIADALSPNITSSYDSGYATYLNGFDYYLGSGDIAGSLFDDKITILLENPLLSYDSAVGFAQKIKVLDINGDGNMDIALQGNKSFYWFLNFGTNMVPIYASSPDEVVDLHYSSPIRFDNIDSSDLLDVDGDGDIDYAFATNNGVIGIVLNEGDKYNPEFLPDAGTHWSTIAVEIRGAYNMASGDINMDGFEDIITRNSSGKGLVIYGPAYDSLSVLAAVEYEGPYIASGAFADYDLDGDLDVLAPDGGGIRYNENMLVDDSSRFRYVGEFDNAFSDKASKQFSVEAFLQPIDDPLSLFGDINVELEEDSRAASRGLLMAFDDADGLEDGDYFSIAEHPNFGSASIDAGLGQWLYKPNDNYYGADEFTVVIADDDGHEVHQEISINVLPVDDPITINGPTEFRIGKGESLTSQLTAIDEGDGLTDGSYFSIEDHHRPEAGPVIIDPSSGEWVYTPHPESNFQGVDRFVVSITDDAGFVFEQPITVQVVDNDGQAFYQITRNDLLEESGAINRDEVGIYSVQLSQQDPDGHDGKEIVSWEVYSELHETWVKVGEGSQYRPLRSDQRRWLRASVSYTDQDGFLETVFTDDRLIGDWDEGPAIFSHHFITTNANGVLENQLALTRTFPDPDALPDDDYVSIVILLDGDPFESAGDVELPFEPVYLSLTNQYQGRDLAFDISYLDEAGYQAFNYPVGKIPFFNDGQAEFTLLFEGGNGYRFVRTKDDPDGFSYDNFTYAWEAFREDQVTAGQWNWQSLQAGGGDDYELGPDWWDLGVEPVRLRFNYIDNEGHEEQVSVDISEYLSVRQEFQRQEEFIQHVMGELNVLKDFVGFDGNGLEPIIDFLQVSLNDLEVTVRANQDMVASQIEEFNQKLDQKAGLDSWTTDLLDQGNDISSQLQSLNAELNSKLAAVSAELTALADRSDAQPSAALEARVATLETLLASYTNQQTNNLSLAPNNSPTGRPTITGSTSSGERIALNSTAISDEDGLDESTRQHQWQLFDPSTGAWAQLGTTDATDGDPQLLLTAALVGQQLRGQVSYVDGNGLTEVVSSDPFTVQPPRPDGPYQQVFTEDSTLGFSPGQTVDLPLLYSSSDQDPNLNGLVLNLHFNPNLITPVINNGVIETVVADITDSTVIPDHDDLDHDPLTTDILQLVWASFSNNFPGTGALPAELATIRFQTADGNNIDPITGEPLSTSVNYTAAETSSGYGFYSSSTTLEPRRFHLDVDGDGEVTPLGDGLMIIRKLFGPAFVGDKLTSKAISPDATRTTAEIHDFIQDGINAGDLDVDQDGDTTALGDGLMVIRRLFGPAFEGDKLTEKAISPDSPYATDERPWEAVATTIDGLLI